MRGMRFYKEYDNPALKRKDRPNGNVFAVEGNAYRVKDGSIFIKGYGSIYSEANSPCCAMEAQLDWLHDCCKRISEAEARKIHPKLFERIEQ